MHARHSHPGERHADWGPMRGARGIAGTLPRVLAHLQILQADLKVQLAGAGDDMLARLLNGALDHGVRFGQALQTCIVPHGDQ